MLEIGVGSGLNLRFYSPEVEHLYGVDPSVELQRTAAKRKSRSSHFIGQWAEERQLWNELAMNRYFPLHFGSMVGSSSLVDGAAKQGLQGSSNPANQDRDNHNKYTDNSRGRIRMPGGKPRQKDRERIFAETQRHVRERFR